MPIIQLPSEKKYWIAFMAATAFFPKSPREREIWYKQQLARCAKDFTDKLCPVPADTWATKRYFQLRSIADEVTEFTSPFKEQDNRDIKWASLIFLQCVLSGESLNKARSEVAGSHPALPNISLDSAEKAVDRAWKRFSSSVHIVAAYALLAEAQLNYSDDAEMLVWFGLSEYLRTLGETHKPKRAQRPLLNRNETYRLPDGMALPNVRVTGWQGGKGTLAVDFRPLLAPTGDKAA